MNILRNRLMVGHLPLEEVILVRVQVPQPKNLRFFECGKKANNFAFVLNSKDGAMSLCDGRVRVGATYEQSELVS